MADIILSAGVRSNLLSLQSTSDLIGTTDSATVSGITPLDADNPNVIRRLLFGLSVDLAVGESAASEIDFFVSFV